MKYPNMEAILNEISDAQGVAIAGHINPDGDSIGSLLSLGLGLKELEKKVYMLTSDVIPERYKSLSGADEIVSNIDDRVDLAISVDCSTKQLLGEAYEVFEKASNTLEIDHHEFRRSFADISLIDKKAAAVGEIIYVILCRLNIDIDKEIAQNILTSIIVETNSFRVLNLRPFTFEVCKELVERGVDFYKLSEMIYWRKSKEAMRLIGKCLSKSKFLEDNKIAWAIIEKNELESSQIHIEEISGVVNELLFVEDVKISILLREQERGKLRVSLRSKGKYNVSNVARKFGGGGHYDAAGCIISSDEESIKKFLEAVKSLI